MPNVNGVTFDLSQAAPKAATTGYTRQLRAGLSDEGYVKFRDAVVKKIIKTPLTSNLQVSSYKPSEMDSKSNFFNVIANWSQASLKFEAWMRTHCVHTVFDVVEATIDATTASNSTIRSIGNLFKNWHTLTLDQVYASCEAMYNYSSDVVEGQNLNLSWEFLMANIDQDLQAGVIQELSRYVQVNPDIAQSGPMAFHVIANRIIRATDALAHNVVTGVMGMGLIHFKGEDVVECVSVLRNVLLFLGHGAANSKCPPTIMDTLVDIFLRCSNPTFVNFVRNLKDFHGSKIDAPEKLFSEVQVYYNTLLSKPNGWLRTTKNRSAFLATLPEMATAFEATAYHDNDETKPNSSGGKSKASDLEYDKSGKLIDRKPPTNGKTERTTADGTIEKWCGRCPKGGRWGSHDSAGHDAWYKDFKERRDAFNKKKKEKKEKKAAEEGASSTTTTSVTPPFEFLGEVYFSSCVSCSPSFYFPLSILFFLGGIPRILSLISTRHRNLFSLTLFPCCSPRFSLRF